LVPSLVHLKQPDRVPHSGALVGPVGVPASTNRPWSAARLALANGHRMACALVVHARVSRGGQGSSLRPTDHESTLGVGLACPHVPWPAARSYVTGANRL